MRASPSLGETPQQERKKKEAKEEKTNKKEKEGKRNSVKKKGNHLVWFGLVWFYGTSTIIGYLIPNPFLYIRVKSKVGDLSRGGHKGSLFNSYYTKM